MTESDELFGSNVNKGVWTGFEDYPEVPVLSQSYNNRAKKSIERYICAYMGPGESNCQGWQMPLHALPTQIVFTRVILVIIFLFRATRTVHFR